MAGKGGTLSTSRGYQTRMAEDASITALMDRVARTAPFHRPGVPFVAALCIRTIPDTARAWVIAPHLRAQESLAAQLETWGVRNILFVPEKEVALGEEVGDPELAAERSDGRQPE